MSHDEDNTAGSSRLETNDQTVRLRHADVEEQGSLTNPNPKLTPSHLSQSDPSDAQSMTKEEENFSKKGPHGVRKSILRASHYLRKNESPETSSAMASQSKQDKASAEESFRKERAAQRNELQRTSVIQAFRKGRDEKVVGLKNYGLNKSGRERRRRIVETPSAQEPSVPAGVQGIPHRPSQGGIHLSFADQIQQRDQTGRGEGVDHFHMDAKARMNDGNRGPSTYQINAESAKTFHPVPSVEDMEYESRKRAITNPWKLVYFGNLAALKVMLYYLITIETIVVSAITAGLTCFWYFNFTGNEGWSGMGMDFILLAFAVISPITAALGMAFNRRERALISIADFRSFSYHLYLAHCSWDWQENGGRALSKDIDWLEHCDAVLSQLIGIGDELARFLSLPTTSRSRHRMTRQGRREAARTIEVAYHLLESMTTQRMTRLSLYAERLKKAGLPSGEVSRIRQYERFLSDMLEQLRMVKMYRTPQALRSFARIFILILPPFYSPTYAQLAFNVNSLGFGVTFGILTAFCLTALFESMEVLEDPFTAFLALDGIDVREEFEVLHFAQLTSTRRLCFPNAPEFPAYRRAALTGLSTRPEAHHFIGLPPAQTHHEHHPSHVPSLVDISQGSETNDGDTTGFDVDNEHEDVELGTVLGDDNDDYSLIRETIFSDADDTIDVKSPSLSRVSLSSSGRLARRKRFQQLGSQAPL